MIKGSYYYIEALHKEQYGNDSLAAAVQTPDNKTYAPIPSQFLWTASPVENPGIHPIELTVFLSIPKNNLVLKALKTLSEETDNT